MSLQIPQYYPTKHTEISTILFHKSIVSFVAAMALVSRVTASPAGTEPAGNGQKHTQAVVPSCSTGTPTCCDSTTPFSSLSTDNQAALAALDSNLNKALLVGAVRSFRIAGMVLYSPTFVLHLMLTHCSYNQALCCDAIQNQGQCL